MRPGSQKGAGTHREADCRILATHDGDRYAAADELETIYIQMEDAEYAMGAAYGPLLEHLATVHILATPSVEAHVDSQAHELLSG
jgi:hypothetical protein